MLISLAIVDVIGAGGERHQHLDLLPDQLLARIAKRSFSHLIHQDNSSGAIHFENRVGRGVEKLAKAPLGAEQIVRLRVRRQAPILTCKKIAGVMKILAGITLTAMMLGAAPKPARVVLIGVDGLGSAGLRAALKAGRAPNVQKLIERGSWSPAGRGIIPTVSSPNWATILMGAGPERHGITSNEWERHQFQIPPVCRGSEEIFPTMVGALREQRPKAKIAVIHDWAGFARLVEQKAVTYQAHPKGSKATAEAAAEYWKKERPELMLVHLDDVDHAGHGMGWETPEYAQAVADADGYIGTVLAAIASTGDESSTLVVLTADHGGVTKKHGGLSQAEIEIPILFAGPGVPKGREFTRTLGNIEIAPGIFHLLGLKAHACWTGRAPEFKP